MNLSQLVAICSSVIFLCPLMVQAQTTDVLVLKNGDRITGEITRIWDDEVTIEPEYSDEFNVDVPAVAYIESEREFEIDLADGRELVVTFPGADAEGNQIIKTGSGTEILLLSNMLELDEPEDYYDWDTLVDLSGDLKKDLFDVSGMFATTDRLCRRRVLRPRIQAETRAHPLDAGWHRIAIL